MAESAAEHVLDALPHAVGESRRLVVPQLDAVRGARAPLLRYLDERRLALPRKRLDGVLRPLGQELLDDDVGGVLLLGAGVVKRAGKILRAVNDRDAALAALGGRLDDGRVIQREAVEVGRLLDQPKARLEKPPRTVFRTSSRLRNLLVSRRASSGSLQTSPSS